MKKKKAGPNKITLLGWEKVVEVWRRNSENISETARDLGMHRRTIQRILRRMNIAPL